MTMGTLSGDAWLVLLLACMTCGELIRRWPLRRMGQQLLRLTSRIVWVLLSPRISDHWKERVLPAYAMRLLGWSSAVLLATGAIISPLMGALWWMAPSWSGVLHVSMALDVAATLVLVPLCHVLVMERCGV